jgi:hypothetical protein
MIAAVVFGCLLLPGFLGTRLNWQKSGFED